MSAILTLISSCNHKADNGQKESTNTEVKTPQLEQEAIDNVPSFENPSVQEYVDSYEAYLKEYSLAIEKNDTEMLSRLGPKGQELALKAQKVSENMSIEDAQKFRHYLTEKTEVIQELTSKLTK